MAGSIATAYVQVMPSMEGIKGNLEKGFGAEGTKSGKSFGSNLVKTAMGVIASAQVGKALWSTLNAGAELQQNLGGVQAVYGEFASSITASAEKAYSQMGLSASEYMATANKMGSLFQGSGLEQQRAMELTTQAMQRAADVASVMGIETSMAMESIAGAAKGNFTMMDNLGVAMNATTLEAYALEKGINFKWNTASQAQKAELAMEMFFDRTSQYAGNFEREASETFSGAFESMKASAQNVLGNLMLGENIKPSLSALVQTTKTFLIGNFLPAVKNVVSAVPGVIKELSGEIADSILGVFGTDLETVISELDTIFAPVKQSIGGLFNTIAEVAGPTIQPVIDAFREWVDSGQAMSDTTDAIKSALETLSEVVSTVIDGITDFVTWITSGTTSADLFLASVTGIATAFGAFNAVNTVVGTISRLTSVVSMVKGAFTGFFTMLMANPFALVIAAVTGLVAAIVYLWNTNEGFRNAITSAWNAIKTSIVNAITGAKEGFNQFIAGCRMLADGAAQIWAEITAATASLAASITGFFTNTIPAAIQSMISWFQQLSTQISTALNTIIGNVISWVVEFTNKAVEAATGFYNNIVDGLSGLANEVYSIGESVVNGIWNGISAGWGWLKDSVAGLATSLFESAKEALDINSPSKVFRDGVGRWIPAGIAEGIRDYSGLVTSAITDIASDTQSRFTAALRVNMPRETSGGPQTAPGGKVVNFVQNVYAQAQSAAELAQETRYQAEMKVLLGV